MGNISTKDIYLFLVIIFSGSAIPLFRDALGLVILFVVGAFIFRKELFKTDKRVIRTCIIWVAFSALQIMAVGKVNIFVWFTYFSKILIGCWLFSYFGYGLIIKYVKIIYWLCLLSLFFFVWQLINYSSLDTILGVVNIGGSFGAKNILVYNLFNDPTFRMINATNCGFCYEPGPFGGFISLAVIFLIYNKSVFTDYKKYLIVLILSIITTQSSSSYVCGLVIVLWYFVNKFDSPIKKTVVFVLLFGVVFAIFNEVPVLREKINDEFMGLGRYEIVIAQHQQSSPDEALSLGRFVAWQFDWETFRKYPLFGIAADPSLHALQVLVQDTSVSAINGLGKLFAFYGLFGVLVFFSAIVKSGNIYASISDIKSKWLFPVVIVCISFAFSIIETPFFVMIWLLPFIIPDIIKRS